MEKLRRLETAAFFLQCGAHGDFIEKPSSKVIYYYSVRRKYHALFLGAAVLLLLLHFFERPCWTYHPSFTDTWYNTIIYPSYGLAVLPLSISIPLSTLLLFITFIAAYLEESYQSLGHRKRSFFTIPRLVILIILMKLIQNAMNSISIIYDLETYISFSPIETLILLLLETRYVTNIIYFCHTIPMFSVLILILGVGISIYTGLAFLFFDIRSAERQVYYPHYSDGLWNMLMVLSGSNWPSPIIPAYESNRLSIFFYFFYLIILNWGLLNFVLGYICSVYRGEQRILSYQFEKNKYLHLKRAYVALQGRQKGSISNDDFIYVLRICHQQYQIHMFPPTIEECDDLVYSLIHKDLKTQPNIGGRNTDIPLKTQSISHHYYQLASTSQSPPSSSLLHQRSPLIRPKCRIKFKDFCRFYTINDNTALHMYRRHKKVYKTTQYLYTRQHSVDLSAMQRVTWSSIYYSKLLSSWYFICALSVLPIYDLCLDSIMVILGVTFLLTQYHSISVTLLIIQGIDIILKNAALGSFSVFLYTLRGRFDLFYFLFLFVFLLVENATNYERMEIFFINALTLIRIFVLPRSIIYLEIFTPYRYKLIESYKLVLVSAQSFSFLILLLFLLMYTFADIGVHVFGGIITTIGPNADLLNQTSYGINGYWPVNMNDLFSAFVTMFILLHVNNTHLIAAGFRAVTNEWCEVFFTIWYIVGILLLLNILTAFFLTGFFQYLKSLNELAIEKSCQVEKGEDEVSSPVTHSEVCVIQDTITGDNNNNKNKILDTHSQQTVYASAPNTSSGYVLPVTLPVSRSAHNRKNDCEDNSPIYSGNTQAPVVDKSDLHSDRSTAIYTPKSSTYYKSDDAPASNNRSDVFDNYNNNNNNNNNDVSISSFEIMPIISPQPLRSTQHNLYNTQSSSTSNNNNNYNLMTNSHRNIHTYNPASHTSPPHVLLPTYPRTRRYHSDTLSTVSFSPIETAAAAGGGAGWNHSSDITLSGSLYPNDSNKLSKTMSGGRENRRIDCDYQQPAVDHSSSDDDDDDENEEEEYDDHSTTNTTLLQAYKPEYSLKKDRSNTENSEELNDSYYLIQNSKQGLMSQYQLQNLASYRTKTPSQIIKNRRTLTERIQKFFHFPDMAHTADNDIHRSPSYSLTPSMKRSTSHPGNLESISSYYNIEDLKLSSTSSLYQPLISRQSLPYWYQSTNHETSHLGHTNSIEPTSPIYHIVPSRPPLVTDFSATQHMKNQRTSSPFVSYQNTTKDKYETRGLLEDGFPNHSIEKDFKEEEVCSVTYTPTASHTHVKSSWVYTICRPIYDCLHWFQHDGDDDMSIYESAAVYVQCAREGSDHSHFHSQHGLFCFRLRHKLSSYFIICCWINLILYIFRSPVWIYTHTKDLNNINYYPHFNLPYIPPRIGQLLHVPFLVFILYGLFLEYGYQEEEINANKTKKVQYCKPWTLLDIYQFALIVFSGVEVIVYSFGILLTHQSHVWRTCTTVASVLYVFWFDFHSRWKLSVVFGLLPRVFITLTVYILIVIMFASFGPYIFNINQEHTDDDYNQLYFSTYLESIWSVFTSITSSSFPDQVMPLYRVYRYSSLYFMLFVSLGSFVAMNLILVMVLYEYRTKLQSFAEKNREIRDQLLSKAFDILDTAQCRYLSYESIIPLMNELFNHYHDFRKQGVPNLQKRNLLIKILDIDGDGKISKDDFLFFIDVTRINIKQATDATFIQLYCPCIAYSSIFIQWSRWVTWKWYDPIFDTIVTALILWRLIQAPNIRNRSSLVLLIHSLLLVIMLTESTTKLLVYGVKETMKRLASKINLLLTIGFTITMILTYYHQYILKRQQHMYTATIQFILIIIRLICYPRITLYFLPRRALVAIQLFNKIVRRMTTLSITFFCISYVFATVGVTLYGGVVTKDPDSQNYALLASVDYGKNNYWTLNFNDIPSALVTLFCALHVSDFDVITEGFVMVTNRYARLYFILWYILGVLVLLNMIKSFFLTEFLPTVAATLKTNIPTDESIVRNELLTEPKVSELKSKEIQKSNIMIYSEKDNDDDDDEEDDESKELEEVEELHDEKDLEYEVSLNDTSTKQNILERNQDVSLEVFNNKSSSLSSIITSIPRRPSQNDVLDVRYETPMDLNIHVPTRKSSILDPSLTLTSVDYTDNTVHKDTASSKAMHSPLAPIEIIEKDNWMKPVISTDSGEILKGNQSMSADLHVGSSQSSTMNVYDDSDLFRSSSVGEHYELPPLASSYANDQSDLLSSIQSFTMYTKGSPTCQDRTVPFPDSQLLSNSDRSRSNSSISSLQPTLPSRRSSQRLSYLSPLSRSQILLPVEETSELHIGDTATGPYYEDFNQEKVLQSLQSLEESDQPMTTVTTTGLCRAISPNTDYPMYQDMTISNLSQWSSQPHSQPYLADRLLYQPNTTTNTTTTTSKNKEMISGELGDSGGDYSSNIESLFTSPLATTPPSSSTAPSITSGTRMSVEPTSSGTTRRFEASTEYIKDLNPHDLAQLHDRMRQVAMETSYNLLEPSSITSYDMNTSQQENETDEDKDSGQLSRMNLDTMTTISPRVQTGNIIPTNNMDNHRLADRIEEDSVFNFEE